jgi:serine/threonine protein kinase
MISERWQRVKEILVAVDGLDAAKRQSVLASMCQDDSELRQDVDSLLAQEDRIEWLDEPVARVPVLVTQPQQVGPYRIERLLGAGGMGAVYLARRSDDQYQKLVAIKIIQSLNGSRLERRFRTERQILASLEHPAIARLLDGGTLDDGRPYFVMEFVEGCPIDQYVSEHNLGVEAILQLFLIVCSAVQYAHQNLIVHRDLKPGNILVAAAGNPRLLDFGIAKMLTGAVEDETDRTRPFERLLTPSSASPEQVAGGAVTTASDVYSLGLLLYRLLTGVSPYAGAPNFRTDPNAVILRYDPPLASNAIGINAEREKAVRGDLEVILAKALEKEISRRYQTAEELAAEIQRYLEGRPIKARSRSRLYVASRFIRRNQLQVAAAALLVAAIAGGMTGTILYARRAQRQKQLAEQRLDRLRRVGESLLFEFHDSIKDLPGATEARALVVRHALQYLDEVAEENSSDPEVQRDLAAGYVRIGTVLAGERGPHIGGPNAMSNAIKGYERALAIRRRLLTAHPGDAAIRSELLESLFALAFARRAEGRFNEAVELLQERLQVIDTSPQRESFGMQYSLAATYSGLSEMARGQGNTGETLAYAKQALQIRQALLKQHPDNRRAERALGLSWDIMGYALADQKRYAEAARNFQNSLDTFHHLVNASPPNTDLQRNVEVAEMNVCEMLARSGEPSQGVPHCQKALDIASAMYRADPQNVQAQEDTAEGYATVALTLHLQKKTRAALLPARQAVALFQRALAQDPDATEATAQYADALVELASIEHVLRERSACDHSAEARKILGRLSATAPADATIQRRLSEIQKKTFCR